MFCFVLSLIATSQATLGIGRFSKVTSVLLARVSSFSLPTYPICPGVNLMSTWLTVVLSKFVKRSTASRVVLDFILVLSRAIIKFAAWLSQFLFLISANIRWDADLPTAKLQLETQSHCCQNECLLRLCHYD